METIVAIDYINDEKRGDGYVITTTNQKIQVLVSYGHTCCKVWGCPLRCTLLKPHDVSLENSHVFSVNYGKQFDESLENVDACMMQVPLKNIAKQLVIDIKTSVGLVQLVAFNEHFGCLYYSPHTVYVSWDGHEDTREL